MQRPLKVNYERTFGKHQVEGLFLYNQRDYQQFEESYDIVPYRRMGIAGRASYTYDNRYIAEFNFGYNGSENFAKGYRFGFFPSVAIGYLLSEEKTERVMTGEPTDNIIIGILALKVISEFLI